MPNFTLATAEKHALHQAINPQIIEDNGWAIQKNGSILNENGRKIFEVLFINAIEKVLKNF
ncbi:gamma-mobile-trio protein GmtX [Acinetobacter soli]|uniref:gamma-mobile-trio protein GmtX n=1 Tax=Acinetobacter soli TaxID=487316 RepID=UPI0023BA5817|nr:gamma-mobile-trio protein GmtX [Acinetobacter soli]